MWAGVAARVIGCAAPYAVWVAAAAAMVALHEVLLKMETEFEWRSRHEW